MHNNSINSNTPHVIELVENQYLQVLIYKQKSLKQLADNKAKSFMIVSYIQILQQYSLSKKSIGFFLENMNKGINKTMNGTKENLHTHFSTTNLSLYSSNCRDVPLCILHE